MPPTAQVPESVPRSAPTPEAAEPAIAVSGLTKSFGDVRALDGVSFEAAPGTVFGLLGPNGAGKTTAVRVLTTLLRPDSGSACVAGFDVVRDAVKLRHRIGLAGQYAAVDENLTGLENLVMVGRLYGMSRAKAKERGRELLADFDLLDAADRPARTYSGGMRRRLDLADALVAKPPVLFLDEPTTGLDPRSRLALWETIEGLVADGMTVLLTTQYLDEADRLADHIAVIDHGRVIADGTPDELKDRVGGERLEVTLADIAGGRAAAQALAAMSDDAAGRRRLDREGRGPAAQRRDRRGGAAAGRGRRGGRRPRPAAPDARRRVPGAHRPRGRARPTTRRTTP